MGKNTPVRTSSIVLALLTLGSALGSLWAAPGKESVVGRIRVTETQQESASQILAIREAIEGKFAATPGQPFADRRVVSLRPRTNDPTRFDVTIYDYSLQKGFELVMDTWGNELAREPLPMQPDLTASELEDAETIVSQSPIWAEQLTKGSSQIYPAMPAFTIDETGRRLITVGILTQPKGAPQPLANEVVSVDIPAGKIIRYHSGAPETSSASLLVCNPPPAVGCGAAVGSCAAYHVEWPAANPVWKFDVRHPSCTDSVQGSGTGLELTNVYFNNMLILQRAEMPVLNVLYQGNTCGPYRDWLDSEDCFQATGTDVPAAGSGIRVTTGNPTPQTFCESGSDAGNFKGVAIHDEGNALYLLTETNAGWYRYIMEWRLFLDGTIEPIFGFGATSNGCTCNLHYHHAYWRFEWALGGTSGNPATGIASLERRHAGTLDQYDPVTAEAKFIRPAVAPESDWFRIRSTTTQAGYIFEPGVVDGQANGDAYGKWDFAALAYNSAQIDDPNTDTSVNIDPWVNGEALGTTKRLVTWYHATYTHDGNVDPEPCELVGPRLVFVQGCAGTVGIDRPVYGCGSSMTLSVDDADLRGAGTVNVAVSSTTELTPETVLLTESPANSGHMTGTLPTYDGPALHGDGKLSVTNGDTITAHYVDASACGTPNVGVDKVASVDCLAPVASGVHAINVTSNGATISWTTNEPSSGTVHYGTTPPGGSTASTSVASTSHSQAITGLVPCTTYYYWVESADPAGNINASNGGGGYYAFTTGNTSTPVNFASSGAPVQIPDSPAAGVTSTIHVANTGTVQDANATANLTHTYDGDLTLELITPSNTSIMLSNRRGAGGDNFVNTVFDDEAATPIGSGSSPFTGSFRPDSPLTVADQLSGTGDWKLKVTDLASVDTGTINSWTLTLSYPGACPAGAAPPPVPDGTFGSALTAARVNGTGSAIHLDWDVTSCPAKNHHVLYGQIGSVSSYAISGAACGAGPLGSYTWTGVPAGDLWFLVVGESAAGVEGSWGKASSGAERGGTTASGQCDMTSRSNAGTCP